MKRIMAPLLAFIIGISLFPILAGCGGDNGGGIIDAGNVSAPCPKGWKGYLNRESSADVNSPVKPNELEIYKDAKNDWDIFTHTGLRIKYYGPDREMDNPDYYFSEPEELSPMEIGGRTWKGYKGLWMGEPRAILWTEEGDNQIRIEVILENDGRSISLDDPDVHEIIAGIQYK